MCCLFIFRQVGLGGEPLIITGYGGFGDDSGVHPAVGHDVSAEVVVFDGAGAGAVSVADIFPGYNLFPMTSTRLGFYDNGRSRNAMNNRCSVFFLLQQVFVRLNLMQQSA